MDQYKFQHCADIFIRNIFNPFHGTGLFLILPEIHQETIDFRMFLGGIEGDLCHEMGYWKYSCKIKLLISSSIDHAKFISCNIDKIVFILFNFSIW